MNASAFRCLESYPKGAVAAFCSIAIRLMLNYKLYRIFTKSTFKF